jgi:hypothetical protein
MISCCSCLAVTLFVEYTIKINSAGGFQHHLDITKYLGNENHLFPSITALVQNKGLFVAQDFLKEITALENSDISYVYASFEEEICSMILRYLKTAPILITGFKVEKNFFCNPPEVVRYESPKIPFVQNIGTHVMLLIGARFDGQQYHVLLQNFWDHRPFVEVSANYLQKCEGCAVFLSNPETLLKISLPLSSDGSSSIFQ